MRTTDVAQLSEWLQIMLAEIARKQQEALRAAEEEDRRHAATAAAAAPLTASAPKSLRSAAG